MTVIYFFITCHFLLKALRDKIVCRSDQFYFALENKNLFELIREALPQNREQVHDGLNEFLVSL